MGRKNVGGIQRLVTGLTKNSEDCGKKQRAAMWYRDVGVGCLSNGQYKAEKTALFPDVSPDQ